MRNKGNNKYLIKKQRNKPQNCQLSDTTYQRKMFQSPLPYFKSASSRAHFHDLLLASSPSKIPVQDKSKPLENDVDQVYFFRSQSSQQSFPLSSKQYNKNKDGQYGSIDQYNVSKNQQQLMSSKSFQFLRTDNAQEDKITQNTFFTKNLFEGIHLKNENISQSDSKQMLSQEDVRSLSSKYESKMSQRSNDSIKFDGSTNRRTNCALKTLSNLETSNNSKLWPYSSSASSCRGQSKKEFLYQVVAPYQYDSQLISGRSRQEHIENYSLEESQKKEATMSGMAKQSIEQSNSLHEQPFQPKYSLSSLLISQNSPKVEKQESQRRFDRFEHASDELEKYKNLVKQMTLQNNQKAVQIESLKKEMVKEKLAWENQLFLQKERELLDKRRFQTKYKGIAKEFIILRSELSQLREKTKDFQEGMAVLQNELGRQIQESSKKAQEKEKIALHLKNELEILKERNLSNEQEMKELRLNLELLKIEGEGQRAVIKELQNVNEQILTDNQIQEAKRKKEQQKAANVEKKLNQNNKEERDKMMAQINLIREECAEKVKDVSSQNKALEEELVEAVLSERSKSRQIEKQSRMKQLKIGELLIEQNQQNLEYKKSQSSKLRSLHAVVSSTSIENHKQHLEIQELTKINQKQQQTISQLKQGSDFKQSNKSNPQLSLKSPQSPHFINISKQCERNLVKIPFQSSNITPSHLHPPQFLQQF